MEHDQPAEQAVPTTRAAEASQSIADGQPTSTQRTEPAQASISTRSQGRTQATKRSRDTGKSPQNFRPPDADALAIVPVDPVDIDSGSSSEEEGEHGSGKAKRAKSGRHWTGL